MKIITYLIEYKTEEDFLNQTIRHGTPALGGVIKGVQFDDAFEQAEKLEERIEKLEAALAEHGEEVL